MAALAYSAITPLTADTCTDPRIDNMRFGGSLVSITTATRSSLRSALSFGAPPNVLITSSDPFQWNHRATTRGVPSAHTYARRAGMLDTSSCCAIGSRSNSDPPFAIHITFNTFDTVGWSKPDGMPAPQRRC